MYESEVQYYQKIKPEVISAATKWFCFTYEEKLRYEGKAINL